MYELQFSENAGRQLEKLPKEIQRRIMACLERIRVNPWDHVSRLIGSPYFRLRVGDYRIILDINQYRLKVMVIKIGHRKDIYK